MKKTLYLVIFIALGVNYTLLSQNEKITINFKRNSDNSIDFYYDKKIPGSFYLNLEFTGLSNAHSKNHTAIIKDASGSFFNLRPINSKQPINFSYKYSYLRGIPNPKVDSLFTYTLPLKKGKTVTIIESTNLSETYFGSEAPSKWKSYIIDRTSSDTVCNMRKGIVVEIVNEFTRNPEINLNYTSKMNRIVVEHEDGTFASYSGLKKDAIFVSLGQTIYPQTLIGTLEAINDYTYRLYFHIYYLIDESLKSKESTTHQKSQNEFLTPYFLTKIGSKKLNNKTNYIVEFNESILFKELSKKEKKQYLKNSEMFK
ncbi:hypothetical protein ACFSKN_16030 [Mariniflexile gromovii]|uniref:Peptidase M23-like protein n=1 Tax=Mariniflexile gromovii TaxID=362523 RepID=A0ABS4BT92_9FLAO|nr:hypothetical protein [Mariniflexile gromovii]MBP0903812.1 hypothetical protein [Mariniflexile gromovii]